jgi:hypothetical protein
MHVRQERIVNVVARLAEPLVDGIEGFAFIAGFESSRSCRKQPPNNPALMRDLMADVRFVRFPEKKVSAKIIPMPAGCG